MNTEQIEFINILTCAIYDKSVEDYLEKKMKWKSIIDEAKEQNVIGLMYYTLNNSGCLKEINKKITEKLKRETFVTGVSQIQHIIQISKVLKLLNKQKIPVIVLKGLIIRELYPRPELRTMGDADILVKKEDIGKIKKVLINLGYIVCLIDEKHIVFEHNYYFAIEVHWTLSDRDYYKGKRKFENLIWENTMKVNIGESEALSLSYEDLAVHLCIHMASHSTGNGFGVRQLCDLVLLVEKKGYLIDWSRFLNKIKLCGIEKFTMVIFSICNKLFNMNIPHELNINIKLLNEDILYQVIVDIFEAGVHGKRNAVKVFSNQLAYDANYKYNLSITKRFMMLLFPPSGKLSNRYIYAKKHRVLMPVAWIHRFLYVILNEKYNFLFKIKFLILTIHISRKRNKLLKWLELI